MSTPAPFAAVFDWDGVIIDSAECHCEGWEMLAAELKLPLPPDHFERSFGRKNAQVIPEILGWTNDPGEIARLGDRKEELYRESVRKRGVDALPGVREWLTRLQEAGVPCGIGSSTPRANIDFSLGLIGCAHFFRTIVPAEDVTQGKPAPEVFLTVGARLGVAPERCIVFEDALVGLEAARRAGMKRIAVTTTNAAAVLAPHADRVVDRLDELTVASCAALFSAA